jgi:Fe-Mn family superoxide dismutase
VEFKLKSLDYDYDALEPHISGRTVTVHHTKHHQGYIDKLKKAIGDKPLARESLEEIVRKTEGSTFNSAAQVWNHDFYWDCIRPDGGGAPEGPIAEALKRDFGTVDDFRQEFATAAKNEFGSGWAWLVLENGKLRVLSTTDAENPLTEVGQVPILTIDVWEHAYYLDYQHERAKYVEAFIDNLINWDFAARNLQDAG